MKNKTKKIGKIEIIKEWSHDSSIYMERKIYEDKEQVSNMHVNLYRSTFMKDAKWEVNWAAHGNVDTKEAKAYAELILAAAEHANKLNAELEGYKNLGNILTDTLNKLAEEDGFFDK